MDFRTYDKTSPASIFAFSEALLGHTLSEAVTALDKSVCPSDIKHRGKGGLGILVEKFWYGYEPNSNPMPDFEEAGVELKTTPLRLSLSGEVAIKERLVCDMIDFMAIVEVDFEHSPFYRKCILMLIIFYLHEAGKELRDLRFLYSVLWQIKDKDLAIIRHDYEVIVGKIRAGRAHELSEGDTLYLGACRKGQKGQPDRSQPFSDAKAPSRAFSLKPCYMRTVLEFVRESRRSMATNTDFVYDGPQLVSLDGLKTKSFEEILLDRFRPFFGLNYKEIAARIGAKISDSNKQRLAVAARQILLKGLKNFEDAEEIRKAGIIAKTIRVEATGRVKESMSFENIDYDSVIEETEWTDSRWYEIVTSRFMFIVYRADETESKEKPWSDFTRYQLDDVFFWTMPTADLEVAKRYWESIRSNVLADTLGDDDNTFWKMQASPFHVRPKARNKADLKPSPISGRLVPKKGYWMTNSYIMKILQNRIANNR